MDVLKTIESYIDWYLSAILKMLSSPIVYLLYQHESDKGTLEKPIIFLVISSLLGSFLLKFISSASIQSGIEYTAVVISILWVIGMSGCVWISFYIVRVKISYLFALSSMCYTVGVVKLVAALILCIGYGFIIITHPNTSHIIDKHLFGDPIQIAPISEIEGQIGQHKQALNILKNGNKDQYTILKENVEDSTKKLILLDKRLEEEKKRAEAAGIIDYEPDKKLVKELGDESIRFMENYSQVMLDILMNLSVRSSTTLLIGILIMGLSIIPIIGYIIIYWKVFKQKYTVSTSKSYISFGVYISCIYPMLLLKLSIESVLV